MANKERNSTNSLLYLYPIYVKVAVDVMDPIKISESRNQEERQYEQTTDHKRPCRIGRLFNFCGLERHRYACGWQSFFHHVGG